MRRLICGTGVARSGARPAASWFAASAFLALGLFVFLWGTAYKVYLYSVESSGSVPAKLSTRATDVARADVDTAIRPPSPEPDTESQAVIHTLTLCVAPVLIEQPVVSDAPPRNSFLNSPQASPHLALRPPPSPLSPTA